ncbi:MAG: hypothetical protein H5U19_13715 [Rhodobacteraceae bacterium]|nr:hypothetical protein [Paracoccaceae bacterium]
MSSLRAVRFLGSTFMVKRHLVLRRLAGKEYFAALPRVDRMLLAQIQPDFVLAA